MKMIKILGMRTPLGTFKGTVVNVCTNGDWQGLSPFLLGPCDFYGGFVSLNMENAWQFAKLYPIHSVQGKIWPTQDYWTWAKAGWANPQAVRYPMGRGKKPLCAWWDGKALDYIEARKKIYAPLYAKAVQKNEAFLRLKELTEKGDVALRDFDGYDHDAQNLTLTQVLNNPKRKMGHAFVLKMLLTDDLALKQIG